MKKAIKLFSLLSILLLCNILSHPVKTFADPVEPEVKDDSIILLDADTGQVLLEKNKDEKLPPASTTKVMTALLTIENCKLTDVVTVGKNPPFADGSSIALKEGDQYTVNDLLHGLLLESGNDCAEALAEHISGSIDKFAELMNERAKELGCKDTHFINPSGLYDENHFTTAYDLALITRESFNHPEIVKIATELSYELPPSKVDNEEKWTNNKNKLILKESTYYYENAVCGKTGYTVKSNFTYTALAEKDGHKLIVSLLNYPDKESYYHDVKDTFEYGFNAFKKIKLYSKGDEVSTYPIDKDESVPLLINEDVYYTVKTDDFTNLSDLQDVRSKLNCEFKLEEKDLSNSSFNKNQPIIDSDLVVENYKLSSESLLSGVDREYTVQKSIESNIKDNIVLYSIIAFVSVILLFILISRASKFLRKRKKNKIISKIKK